MAGQRIGEASISVTADTTRFSADLDKALRVSLNAAQAEATRGMAAVGKTLQTGMTNASKSIAGAKIALPKLDTSGIQASVDKIAGTKVPPLDTSALQASVSRAVATVGSAKLTLPPVTTGAGVDLASLSAQVRQAEGRIKVADLALPPIRTSGIDTTGLAASIARVQQTVGSAHLTLPPINTSSVTTATGQVTNAAEEMEGNVSAASVGIGASIARFAGPAVLGAAGLAFVKMGLSAAGAMEQTQIAFEGLLGSEREATAEIAKLQQFAAKTPFEFAPLVDAEKRLIAVGQSAEQARDSLTKIGDVAAVLGAPAESINQVVLALARIKGQGRATLQDFELITSALPGFNSIAAVAKEMGISTQEAFKQFSQGGVNADIVLKGLLTGMATFKGAAGAMERQSETLNGMLSTLSDTIKIQLTNAFKPVVATVKESLPQITTVIGDILGTLGPTVAAVIGSLAPAFLGLAGAIVPLVKAFSTLATTAANVLAPAMLLLGGLVGTVARGFAAGIQLLAPLLKTLTDNAEILAPAILAVGAAFAAVKVADFFDKLGQGTGVINSLVSGFKVLRLEGAGPLAAGLGSVKDSATTTLAPLAGLVGGMGPLVAISGAVGAASIVAGIGIKSMMDRSREAAAVHKAYSTALAEENRTVRESIDAASQAELQRHNQLDDLQELNIRHQDYARAVAGSEEAQVRFRAALFATGKVQIQTVDDQGIVTDKTNESADAWIQGGDAALKYSENLVITDKELRGLNDTTEKRIAAAQREAKTQVELLAATDGYGAAIAQVGIHQDEVAGKHVNYINVLERAREANKSQADQALEAAAAQETVNAEWDSGAVAADKLKDALDRLNGKQVDSIQATIDYQKSVDDLAQSFVDNGASIDANEEKGRANLTAILAQADAAKSLAEATAASAKGTADEAAVVAQARDGLIAHRQALIDQAVASGVARDAAEILANQILGTPEQITTAFHVDDAVAKEKLNFINNLLKTLTKPQVAQVKTLIDQGQLDAAVALTEQFTHTNYQVGVHVAVNSSELLIASDQLNRLRDNAKKGIEVNVNVGGRLVRAAGGPVLPGESYTVGERGRELFVPTAEGVIIPNALTERILAQARSGRAVRGLAEGTTPGTKVEFGDKASVVNQFSFAVSVQGPMTPAEAQQTGRQIAESAYRQLVRRDVVSQVRANA